jgi:hypothetical protein
MPTAAKPFRPNGKRPTGRVLGKQNYGAAWQRFRAWYADLHPAICVLCGAALASKDMHLDHHPPLTGPDDEGMYDENRVRWLCRPCHSRETLRERGGRMTE